MIWNDEGFLISKNNLDENSIVVEAFTLNYGKYSGIVFGGSSRKQKKILQIGNKMIFNLKSKNDNKIGYFNSELIKPVSPMFFDDKKRTICIYAASNLLKILLPERQSNKIIYYSFDKFINDMVYDNWIRSYIFWELSLIKELGFETNFSKMDTPEIILNHNTNNYTKLDISKALVFNRNLLLENFINPNHLKLPSSRNILEKYFT